MTWDACGWLVGTRQRVARSAGGIHNKSTDELVVKLTTRNSALMVRTVEKRCLGHESHDDSSQIMIHYR